MKVMFRDLIKKERARANKVFMEIIKPEDIVFKQLHILNKDFISILINTMPNYFIDVLLAGSAIDINDCNNFINTIYFNIYLSKISKIANAGREKFLYKATRVFFDELYDTVLREVERTELFTKERENLENNRNVNYKIFENEIFLSSYNRDYKDYFDLLMERIKLQNKVKDINNIYIVTDAIRPSNLILEISVIYYKRIKDAHKKSSKN